MITTIKNVHVFDGNTVSTELAHVVINNGYIQSVGAMAPAMCEEYNARGLTLLPGFIDTHIHIDSCDNCALAVKSGITTFIEQMCRGHDEFSVRFNSLVQEYRSQNID